jgi:hypothetical protein
MDLEKGGIYVAMGGYAVTEILDLLPEGRCAFRRFEFPDGNVSDIYDEDLVSDVAMICDRLATPEEVARLSLAAADEMLSWYPRVPLDRLLATIPLYRLKGEMERQRLLDRREAERNARRKVLKHMPAGDVPPEHPEDIWLHELLVAFASCCEYVGELDFSAWQDDEGDEEHPACWFVQYYPRSVYIEDVEGPVFGSMDVYVSQFMTLFDDVEDVHFANQIGNNDGEMRGSCCSFQGMYKGVLVVVNIYAEPPSNEDDDDDDEDDEPAGDIPPGPAARQVARTVSGYPDGGT